MPPELAPPNKFHEGPSGASRMQENLLAAGARLGAYSAPPDLLAGHSPTTQPLLSALDSLGLWLWLIWLAPDHDHCYGCTPACIIQRVVL